MATRTSVHQRAKAEQRRAEDPENGVTTDQDQQFKKSYQEINRPPVTDHNINDEYALHPPNNLEENTAIPTTERWSRGLHEGAKEEELKEFGVNGDEATGRVKKDQALGGLVNGEYP